MSSTRKQAVLGLLFWSAAAILFLTLFFQNGGPDTFASQSTRVLLTSLAYGAGFVIHFLLVARYRARRSEGTTLKDEWDDEVARRANGAALVVTLAFAYAAGIVLWEMHRGTLYAPIGWFWFIAYVTVMVGFIAHAAATLVIDLSRDRDD